MYDVDVKKVSKVCSFLRRYLDWVQNSVFEGELSKKQLEIIKEELKQMLDPLKDSIVIYTFRTSKEVKREILGIPKGNIDEII